MDEQSVQSSETTDRSTRRRQRTRARLPEAARRIITKKSYDATTIGDITEAADVGKGTFYLHFGDKEKR